MRLLASKDLEPDPVQQQPRPVLRRFLVGGRSMQQVMAVLVGQHPAAVAEPQKVNPDPCRARDQRQLVIGDPLNESGFVPSPT